MPLSFKEYISKVGEIDLLKKYRNYITNSSFPYTLELNTKKEINIYLEGIYNSIVLKDIVIRKKTIDTPMLGSVIKFMFDNVGNLTSSTNISNSMTSKGRKISVHTVESYLESLLECFVLYKAERYDIKGKQYLSSGYKYYICDIGLRYYLLGDKKVDMGHILENVVYLELLRRGYKVYVGKIEKFTASRMLDVLDINVTIDEEEDRLSEDDHIIIVDAQKYNSNIKDCIGHEAICIDHHPIVNEPDYLFCDIRPEVGACSSIVASYFFEAGIIPDRKTATTLIYGIRMDTLDLKRGANTFDVEMFNRLYPFADTDVLAQIQSNSMQFEDLMAFGEAIKNIQVYDNIGLARLDIKCSDGVIAEISDFILDLREVELCVVYAMRSNGIKLSVRSELKDINAGIAIVRALEGIGTGGGHAEMAGGFIPIANVTKQTDDDIRVRFLTAFGEYEKCRG